MNMFGLMAVVAAIGAVGGLLNCLVAGEFHLPHRDKKARIWRSGWIGNILAGAAASLISWSFNGQLGGTDFFQLLPPELHFTPVQMASALLIGLGGGRFLTNESRRLILQHERDEERQARIDLATSARRKPKNHGNNPGTGA